MSIKITALYERLLAEYDSEQSGLEGRIEEITTPMLNKFI